MKVTGIRWRSLAAALLSAFLIVGVQASEEFETVADAPAAAAVRPNIVFILADDLGYTDIAPYGSEVNTPTLSALAEQGVRFTNYHTAANCAPARAMLLLQA